jgi:hypothetical protein
MSVMLTGGIRRKAVAERAINEGIAVVGMATALALRPDLPDAWRRGDAIEVTAPSVNWKSKPLASLATRSIVDIQMQRLSRGRAPSRCVLPALALLRAQVRTTTRTRQYVAWAERQARQGEAS